MPMHSQKIEPMEIWYSLKILFVAISEEDKSEKRRVFEQRSALGDAKINFSDVGFNAG
jgi:hypothetical protein